MYRVRRLGLLLTIFIIGLLMGKYGPTVINMLLSTVFILTWLMAFDESSYKRIQKNTARIGVLNSVGINRFQQPIYPYYKVFLLYNQLKIKGDLHEI